MFTKDKISFQMLPLCYQDAGMQVMEIERHVQYKWWHCDGLKEQVILWDIWPVYG